LSASQQDEIYIPEFITVYRNVYFYGIKTKTILKMQKEKKTKQNQDQVRQTNTTTTKITNRIKTYVYL